MTHHQPPASQDEYASHQKKPLIVFDAEACRAWLNAGAAKQAGIDEGFNSEDFTIASGLEDLLSLLHRAPQRSGWHTRQPLDHVSIWRTADNDGVDGGGILTADLTFGEAVVRIASLHQGSDEFTSAPETCGIEAAIEALRHTAEVINREYAILADVVAAAVALQAAENSPTYTVIGVWLGDQPVPIGVIEGQHEVHGGDDSEFPEGLWATSVTAADPGQAEQAAITELLESHA